ncbi:hypothetical protein NDR87_15275 [Nocardia sp. CDC159]|uniref:DUF6545 domain-containing protein n=1 Tax=Nocardia pulmonis TaxID=2951408 RepID=A0A9X2E7H7_9NOCA|nr:MULTISPECIES: MAB_1171c family putative transporter [Nocardia]MCM6775547.1 hypothetical protein [Nocardia pulmonis]MCM6787719.1 hypothetical protein [Nocardia sp. CDC159]
MLLQVCLIAVLAIGAVWKGIDLLRGRDDRVLGHLVAAFVLLALGNFVSLRSSMRAIDSVTQPGVGRVLMNVTVMIGLYALMQVFVLAAPRAPRRLSRRLHTWVLVLSCVALVACMIATPREYRAHSLTTPHIAEPPILLFYLVGNAYFVYAYVYCGFLARRYAARAPRYQMFGLTLVSVGLFGLALTSFNRGVWVIVRVAHGDMHGRFNAVNFSIANVCTALIVIGLCYPATMQAISALRSWFLHRRQYRELATLWSLMSAAFPELMLGRGPASSPLDRLFRPSIHARFYRRLIECRDGLVRLSPYIEERPGTDLTRMSNAELAVHIRQALARKPPVEDLEVAYSAKRLAVPDGDDLHAEARVLMELSRALKDTTP